MTEVFVYGTEKLSCRFSFTHDMQRFVLCLCPLFAGHMFSSKLKPLHHHIPYGDSILEMSLHHFMLMKFLYFSELFEDPECEVIIANHSTEDRFMERQSYTSFFLPLEVIFFSVCIFNSRGLTLSCRVIQISIQGGSTFISHWTIV